MNLNKLLKVFFFFSLASNHWGNALILGDHEQISQFFVPTSKYIEVCSVGCMTAWLP